VVFNRALLVCVCFVSACFVIDWFSVVFGCFRCFLRRDLGGQLGNSFCLIVAADVRPRRVGFQLS